MKPAKTLFDKVQGEVPEFSISYKTKGNPALRQQITSSKDIAEICRKCFDSDTIDWVESFIVMGFNRANRLLGFYKVSQGGVDRTAVDAKVIFQFALLCNASLLVLCHNHPSGSIRPSHSDEITTRKLKEAGELLDIKLLDHVILGADGEYYSFCDEGML